MTPVEISVPPGRKSQVVAAQNPLALRFYATFAVLMAILVPAEFILGSMAHLHRMGQQLIEAWPGLIMMSACVAYVRWRPLPRLIEAAQLVLVSCLTFYVMGVLIHVAAHSPYPLVDRQLASLDAGLHFHTSDVVREVAQLPLLRIVLAIAYGTTGLITIAAVIVPAALGRAEYAYRFVLAIIFAVVITAILFHRWPAVGPWTVEGFRAAPDQAAVGEYLTRLRSTVGAMDMKSIAIVSFPSFHTVMAVTAAYALRFIPRVRWFTWTLAALICVSTMTTGWHYAVDVLGGLAVAVVAIATANRVLKDSSPAV